jgi:hypothetical protein
MSQKTELFMASAVGTSGPTMLTVLINPYIQGNIFQIVGVMEFWWSIT